MVKHALLILALTAPLLSAQSLLTPVKEFDLQTCVPSEGTPVAHAFTATRDGIYFLVSPPRLTMSTPQYFVRTDLDGACKQATITAERVNPLSLSVEEGSGVATVLKRYSGQRVEKLQMGSDGRITSRIALQVPTSKLVSFNSDWIGYTDVASSGSLNFYDTQGTVKRSVPLPQTLVSEERFICKLSDALVFVLHGKTGQAEILNAATGTLQQVRVDEADVASSLANYDPKDRSHADIITSAVGDNKGHVFLCFSGIKYTEGALIVKLDSSGSVVHRYRCSLPTRTKFVVPGNPSGAMTPSLIAILDNQLFILDRKGFVSKYLIP